MTYPQLKDGSIYRHASVALEDVRDGLEDLLANDHVLAIPYFSLSPLAHTGPVASVSCSQSLVPLGVFIFLRSIFGAMSAGSRSGSLARKLVEVKSRREAVEVEAAGSQ